MEDNFNIGIKQIGRRKILDEMIRSIEALGKWKILIVDYFGLQVLNSCVKMNELINENITLVEPLEKLRQPYPQLEAIYFIRPTKDAIRRVCEDISPPPKSGSERLYARAHLFFINGLQDAEFQQIKVSPAHAFIGTIRDLHLDYLPIESQVFSLDRPQSMLTFFGKRVTPEQYNQEQLGIARQIANFCISIGEFPYIRFSRCGEFDRVSGKTAALVYRELHRYAKTDKEFPINDDNFLGDNRAELFIVDRSIDRTAPFLHEFTYQAMATDLLALPEDGTKYQYSYEGPDGFKEDVEIYLDEATDSIWRSIRHSHIADCVDEILKTFQDFLADHPSNSVDGVPDIAALKEILTRVPEFQELKKKFSGHIHMTQECLDVFKCKKLREIAEIEQDLATGSTIDGKKPRELEARMIEVIRHPDVGVYDRLRMLITYILNHGVVDEEGRRVFQEARLSPDLKDVVRNLTRLGVDLRNQKDIARKPARNNKGHDQEVSFELSRHIPVIQRLMEQAVKKETNKKFFPFIKSPHGKGTYGADNLAANADQMSIGTMSTLVSRPSWHLHRRSSGDTVGSSPENEKSGKVIVFVIGGMTYSEIRAAYEVTKSSDKDVIIGSTHVITPEAMISDLKQLRDPLEIPEPPEIPFEEFIDDEDPDKMQKKKKKKKIKRIKKIFTGKVLKKLPGM